MLYTRLRVKFSRLCGGYESGGYYFVNSVTQRDYTTIMGVTVFFAAFLMAMVLLVDVFYCLIDPRIQFDA